MSPIVKTGLLIAGLTALFGAVGLMLGGEQGMFIALVMALGMNLLAYWNSDKMMLRMYGAKPLPDDHTVAQMTFALAARAGLPRPKVYYMDTDQPNAFATGRNPENSAVAVTRGLVERLEEDELEGVIAHELAHIKNRDTLIMTVTATIAGALGMLANFAMFFGGSRERGHTNPIVMIAVAVLAPLTASLVQMAISRTREYEADRVGAEISEKPGALAGALQKIENFSKRIDYHVAENNPATAHLFIINPLHAHSVDNLFSTHPKTQNRIARLMEMAGGAARITTKKQPWGQQAKGPWEH